MLPSLEHKLDKPKLLQSQFFTPQAQAVHFNSQLALYVGPDWGPVIGGLSQRAVVQSCLNPDSADSFQFSFNGSPSAL